MKPPPQPINESERLAALKQYELLDTLPEQALDDLTALAAHICQAPISFISLIDEKRQWFKSKFGSTASETSRDVAFCAHAINQPDLLVVTDATQDERFHDNPNVTGDPHIRFYAGAPLVTADGHALGTLCIIDRVPRQLDSAQQEALRVLSRQVMAQLELRRQTRELISSEARLFKVFNRCAVGLTIHRLSDRAFVEVNESFTRMTGWTREAVLGHTTQALEIVEADAAARLRSQLEEHQGLQNVEADIKTRAGDIRHVLVGTEIVELQGEPHAITTFVDVTERKEAEAHAEHLSRVYGVLSEINQTIVREKNPTRVYQRVCTIAVEKGQFLMAWIGLEDKALNRLKLVAQAGATEATLGLLDRILDTENGGCGCAFTQHAFRTGTHAVCNDIAIDPQSAPWRTAALERGYRSMVSLSISCAGKSIGTLNFYAAEPDFFDGEEMRLLDELALDIGFAVEASRNEAERAHAERALRESEERFSKAFHATPASIVITNQKAGRYIDVNDFFLTTFGYTREEVIGRTAADLRIWAIPEQRASIIRNIQEGKPVRDVECLYRTKSDSLRNALVSVEQIQLGGEPCLLFINHDITEGKVTEDQLRASHERFLLITRATNDAVWDWDIASNSLWWNPGYETMFGYAPAETSPSLDSWTNFIHPEDLDPVMQAIHEALDGEAHDWSDQYRFRRKDGTYAEVLDRGYILRNAQGLAVRMLGAMQDITEWKQAKRALQESEQRYRDLVETSHDLIWSVDADGRINFLNQACRRIYGRDPAEMIGRSFLDFVPPDQAHRDLAIFTAALKSGAGTIDYTSRVFRKDGSIVTLSANAQIVRDGDGKVTGSTGISRDISERVRAEETIREQAALLDIAHEAILVKDLEHRITYWNKGAERIYGWATEEVLGRKTSELLYTHTAGFQKAHELLLVQGEWQGEVVQRTKDGKDITVEVRWTLVRDESGNPKSILAINTDITEKKKLEARFLRTQRMESIGTLAGGIAHDLNNVLTPILMSIEMLKDLARNEDDLEVLDSLGGNAKRAAELVKQVLSFARGVEGQRISVNLMHLTDDLNRITRDTFPKSIEVRFTHARDLRTVVGDPTQLHQVLLNLCINARDAMPQGGQLKVGIENNFLDENYSSMSPDARAGEYVVIVVEDTGSGIPAHVKDRIFEPFFTTKEFGKGTGLGLSTTLAIVKSHGGFIDLYSEVGKGTKFKVFLPASVTNVTSGTVQAEEPSLPAGNGQLILVVDDEAAIRAIAQRTLERFGYRTLLAAHGAEAIALYAQQPAEIKLVLTDMAMPTMDGPALIRALKVLNPQIRIICSSGLLDDDAVFKARSAGVKHFVEKPYTAESLIKALREVLG